MLNSRVTRQNITALYPNKYSDDILRSLIFDLQSNFILSANESADTIIFNFNVLLFALLQLSESSDTANFDYENIISATLSKTESSDTAEIDTQLLINFTFDKTEIKDVTEITATNSVPRDIELSVTENTDSSIIYIAHERIQSVRRMGATYSQFIGQATRRFTLNVTEPTDGVKITATSEMDTIISSSEYIDFSCFKIGIVDSAMIKISESKDKIKNDETGFKLYMRTKKLKHEQDVIIKLLMSA